VCWPFPTPGGAWREALGLARGPRPCEYVIASVLLVRGDALMDVGGFDEGFFLYAEEADWERRATGRGWEMRYCPDVHATHEGAATDPDPHRRQVRFHAGVERYIRKWHGPTGWRAYQVATVLTALRRAALGRGRRRADSLALARVYARGPSAVARASGALPERIHHVPALDRPTSS
jgi:GT2 family glycosyltransferase